MATPGANIKYGKPTRMWKVYLQKMGFKGRARPQTNPVSLYNGAADAGTASARQVAICRKYSATTAPQSNTAADAPSGIGDICLHFKSNTLVSTSHVDPTNIDVYRCTAYTNSTTFTWAQIF